MKLFIIFAMVLNVLLMTHSSKEPKGKEFLVDMSLTQKNNHVSKITEEQIQMVPQNKTHVEKNTENTEFNSKPIGKKEVFETIKTRGSKNQYKVEDGKERTFPLFTTFHYREENVNDILIDLNEKQAIDLYLMSNLFRDTIDEVTTERNDAYCIEAQDKELLNYKERVDACQRIRSIDFSKDSPHFNQVHSSHMKKIMEFVNTKDGVAPPEGYIKEVKTSGIVIGDGMSAGNFDIKFVNEIWDKNMKDVGYILSAAMYLGIKSLSQLMGARIAQEIQTACASSDEQVFKSLASITLENEFLVAHQN